MNTWAPIWNGIVNSSLWEEDGDVVKVFMTLLATKDADHVSRLDAFRIAKTCNFRTESGIVDELKVLDILKILASPDTRRQKGQEFEGRRIKAVDGGWLILNGEKYRAMVAKEMKLARDRKSQAAARARKSTKGKDTGMDGTPSSPSYRRGEDVVVKAENNGASQDEIDALQTSQLPKALQ